MRQRTVILFVFCVLVNLIHADVQPVTVEVPSSSGWIGERVPFHVELRAPGTFSGTASIDLPQIPGVLLVKVGEPLVDTKQLEGETWFIQRHEFALFSQRTGQITIPAFPVRFSCREGYTGPVFDVQAQTDPLAFKIIRPPGSDQLGFLVTTETIDITETWDPQPGPAMVGAVFKRTIVQRAENMVGMALAPAPGSAPDGVRVYEGVAETNDNFYRGAFRGERRETITYLLEKPGEYELPAITYVWWNPRTETLQSKTLPGVIVEAAAAPTSLAADTGASGQDGLVWWWVSAVAGIAGLLFWQSRNVVTLWRRFLNYLNPPVRVAGRELLRACRNNDAAAAEKAWSRWGSMQPAGFSPGQELRSAVLELQRQRYGPGGPSNWTGDELARSFKGHLKKKPDSAPGDTTGKLPRLNPR
jgi:hypothetical protein